MLSSPSPPAQWPTPGTRYRRANSSTALAPICFCIASCRHSTRRVADVAEKRESFEGEKRAKLASGVLGLDMHSMREPLAKAGLKYID